MVGHQRQILLHREVTQLDTAETVQLDALLHCLVRLGFYLLEGNTATRPTVHQRSQVLRNFGHELDHLVRHVSSVRPVADIVALAGPVVILVAVVVL